MSVLNNELQFNLGNMLDKIISVCIDRKLYTIRRQYTIPGILPGGANKTGNNSIPKG